MANRSLPTPTRDHGHARRDLFEFGYCIIAEALTAGQIATLRARVEEQASAERDRGLAYEFGDVLKVPDADISKRATAEQADIPRHQIVSVLINKGRVFRDLFVQAWIDEVVGALLGEGLSHVVLRRVDRAPAGPGDGVAHRSVVDAAAARTGRAAAPRREREASRILRRGRRRSAAIDHPARRLHRHVDAQRLHARQRRDPTGAPQSSKRRAAGPETRLCAGYGSGHGAGRDRVLVGRANLARHGTQRQPSGADRRLDHILCRHVQTTDELHPGHPAGGVGRRVSRGADPSRLQDFGAGSTGACATATKASSQSRGTSSTSCVSAARSTRFARRVRIDTNLAIEGGCESVLDVDRKVLVA